MKTILTYLLLCLAALPVLVRGEESSLTGINNITPADGSDLKLTGSNGSATWKIITGPAGGVVQTLPDNAASVPGSIPVWSLDLSSTGYANMGISWTALGNSVARDDQILHIGYNPHYQIANEQSLVWGVESYYNPSGLPFSESYWQFKWANSSPTPPAPLRPIAFRGYLTSPYDTFLDFSSRNISFATDKITMFGATISQPGASYQFNITGARNDYWQPSFVNSGSGGVYLGIQRTGTTPANWQIGFDAGQTMLYWSYNAGATPPLTLTTAGMLTAKTGFSVKSGTNALAGTFTLASGSVSVSSTAIDANTVVVTTLKTSGGTPGTYAPLVTVNAGTGFSVTSIATDNSTYNWVALKVAP